MDKELAQVKPELRMVASLVGKFADTSNEKAVGQLAWHPRSSQEAIIATAQSLINLGIVHAEQ